MDPVSAWAASMLLMRVLTVTLLSLSIVGCRSVGHSSASREFRDDAVVLVSKDAPRGESVELEAPAHPESVPEKDAKRKSGWGLFGSREAMPRTDLKTPSKEPEQSASASSFADGF